MKDAPQPRKSTTLAAAGTAPSPAHVPDPRPPRLDAPQADRRPSVREIHGQLRVDEYEWLRHRDDPAVIAYLEDENRYTDQVMSGTEELQSQLYRELVGRIKEDDTTVPEDRDGWSYFLRTGTGRQYPAVCRHRTGAPDTEVVLLDQNVEAQGHAYYRVSAMDVSPDHRKLAWAEDASGAEEYVVRIRDLDTGADLPDAVPGTSGNIAWSADGLALFYVTLDAAHRPWRVHRHVIGTDAVLDTIVYEEPDEAFYVGVELTRSRAFLLIESSSHTTSETRMAPATADASHFQVVRPRSPGIEYDVSHHGDRLYLLTNHGARNFQLVSVPAADPSAPWDVVIAHDDAVKLDAVDAFAGHLAVYERRNGLQHLRVRSMADGAEHRIALPEPVYAIKRHGNPAFDTSVLRFTYTSLVTPASVVDYDMTTRQWTTRKVQEVRGYDPASYECARITVAAPDGAAVPVSLVWKGPLALDGRRPVYLQGYGAYGVSFDPSFSSNYLSLLDRGLVVAIAHVRGGEELGRAWYDGGKLLNKHNSFTDFIAVAEHLSRAGWTSPDRLVIAGGSAGGLLMGAVTNMRPDCFAAVIADVPFVDVVNTMLDPTLPLTVIEYDEWGNPEEPDAYACIAAYSPYDNVRPQDYPAMLVTAGLNDPRVAYWEPAKFTARLRQLGTGHRPLLLRTNMGAGHSGASGRYDFLKEVAFKYAFVLDQLAD